MVTRSGLTVPWCSSVILLHPLRLGPIPQVQTTHQPAPREISPAVSNEDKCGGRPKILNSYFISPVLFEITILMLLHVNFLILNFKYYKRLSYYKLRNLFCILIRHYINRLYIYIYISYDRPWDVKCIPIIDSKRDQGIDHSLLRFISSFLLGSATLKRTHALPLLLRYPKCEQFDLTSLFLCVQNAAKIRYIKRTWLQQRNINNICSTTEYLYPAYHTG